MKSHNYVPRSRPQRVLYSLKDDEKEERKVRYTFLSSPSNWITPPVWKSFDAKKNYIGILDLRQNVCYVDEPQLFKEVDMATLHKKLMVELRRWEAYEECLKNPRENYHHLLAYVGFAHFNGEWKPNSCTLNAAHSGNSAEVVLKVLEGAGQKKGDHDGKKLGLNIMKPFLWDPLKKELDEMTK